MFSIWRLSWIAHSLRHGTDLFDANIFYPERQTFAYSDAILLPGLIGAWLALQPAAIVLEWPLPRASSLGFTHEPAYMYYSTAHWKPLVNGYSGQYPLSYTRLLDDMIGFPSDASISALHGRRVTHIILHGEYDHDAFAQTRDAMAHRPEFESVITERRPEGDVAVFRLRP